MLCAEFAIFFNCDPQNAEIDPQAGLLQNHSATTLQLLFIGTHDLRGARTEQQAWSYGAMVLTVAFH